MSEQVSTCFVIMPITTSIDSVQDYAGDPDHFEHVLEHLFQPALQRAKFEIIPPSVVNSEIIHAEIIRNLETADLVLCDISGWNANVFFELGIRVALDRPVALVKDTRTASIPFDNALVSCHTYDASLTPWALGAEIERLTSFINKARTQERNALWKYFGITQRASIPSTGDPVQDKLDLMLALLQKANAERLSSELPTIVSPLDFELPVGLTSRLSELTVHEREVLRSLANDWSNARIARLLNVNERTVRNYISSIISKLGVADRRQAGLLAKEMMTERGKRDKLQ